MRDARSPAVDAALEEFHRARAERRAVSIDELCARFPEAGAELREILNDLAYAAQGLEGAAKPSGEALDAATLGGLPADSRLGDFRIVREIGRGGMGVIYEAEQLSLKRRVALKVLRSHLTLDRSTVERFHREATTIAALRHPNIVEIYVVGEQDGHHYFAMELIEGESLDHLLERRRKDPLAATSKGQRETIGMICTTTAAVADALDFAHRHGVVHRDVKPSNVLLGRDGRVILTDFGIARVIDSTGGVTTKEVLGTPHYLAPEQVLGRRDLVDAKTDVYALGVTLFEMLTLRRPFDGDTAQVILARITNQEPTPPRKLNPLVPRDLETICLTAMEKRRELRYGSAAAMAEDLRRFLDYRPIEAMPIGPWERLIRLVRRNPWRFAAGVLFVAAVTGVPSSFAVAERRNADQIARALSEKTAALRQAESEQKLKEAALHDVELERDRVSSALKDKSAALSEKERALHAAEEATTAAQAAEKKATDEQQVTRSALKSLMNMFRGLSQKFSEKVSPDQTISVRDLLDRGLKAVEQEGSREPEVLAISLNTIGGLEVEMGLYEAAVPLLQRAVASWQQVEGPDGRNVNIARSNLAVALAMIGHAREAADLALLVVSAPKDKLPTQQPGATANMVTHVAPACEKSGLKNDEERLLTAIVDHFGGPIAEAESNWQVCAIQLANLRYAQGRSDEGSALYERVERLRQTSLGPKHPETIGIGYFRGIQLIEHGDPEKGRRMIESTLDALRSNGLANHEYVGQCLNGLGWASLKQQELDEAESRFREALDALAKSGFGRDVEKTGQVLQNLRLVADAAVEDGDPDRAEDLLRFVQDGFTQLLGPSSGDAINQRLKRFEILCTQKRLDDALALATETEPLLDLKNHEHRSALVELRVNVAKLRADRGEKDEAARVLRSTIEQVGAKDPLVVPIQRMLDALAAGASEAREAVPSGGHR